MKAIRPVGDKILVREHQEDRTTAGGIVLPDQTKLGRHEGKVVAVGPGIRTITGEWSPLDVKEGDTVWFTKTALVSEVSYDGETLLVMREQEIVAASSGD